MTVGMVTIEYGFTEQDKYTHKMLLGTGDTSDKTGVGGDAGPVNSAASGYGGVSDMTAYAVLYVSCLQELCQPGVKILRCSFEQYSDQLNWYLRTVIHSQQLDFASFAPAAGNSPKAGPRGRAFVGGRQAIADTHRYGWMRWHYISGNLMDLPTLFVPSDVSTQFATSYNKLRNVVGLITSYRVLTGATATYLTDIPKDVPSSVLHMGVRNG